MHKLTGKHSHRLQRLINSLQFLKGKSRWILFWPVAALVIGAIGWGLLFKGLRVDRHQIEQSALDEVAVLSTTYADHVLRNLQTINQTILHVRFEWEITRGGLQLEAVQHRGLFPPGSQVQVVVVDRDGYRLTGTTDHSQDRYFGNRPAFMAQKFAIIDSLYMGQPMVGHRTGNLVLPFSRGLSLPDGTFDGAVLVEVSPAYFTTTYNPTSLGNHGLMSIVGDDYTVRVARIGDKVFQSGAPAFVRTPYFRTLHGSALLDGATWFSDKRSRYVGWQQIEGFPMVAVNGLDADQVLAPYWTARNAAIRNAIWASLGLAVFTLIAMALSSRLAWRKHQLETTQATYRMATEEANEGFFIAKAVWNKHGDIVDFQTLDCNAFGARLLHQRSESIINRRFSEIFTQPPLDKLMEWMRKAMEAGFFETELETPREWGEQHRWLHLRMVRSSDEIGLTMRDITDSKAHVSELERRGNEDALTGLPNRHWVQTYLPEAITRARAQESTLALLFIDLDGFKSINDTFGHQVGDELLRYAGERLTVAVRPHDKVVRLGGDEFLVIIEQLNGKSDAAHVAERVVAAFSEKFRLSQGMHSVGTSIGISMFPADGSDASTLLKHADIAMYSVKTAGKGNYSFYEKKFYDALRTRLDKEHELRRAVEKDEFVMLYQPRLDMATQTMSSLEALVRWNHPVRGMLEPLEFIELAEETGLILRLGELVIDKVCAQLALWSRGDHQLLPVSINVSPRQFTQGDVVKMVAAALDKHKIDPALLEVEITESCMMGESQDVPAILRTLQRMGIKLLIDDFGTGYSSLSQLQRLDFDVLKVDRAFTSELEKTEEGKVFFTAIITMAHALGMRVVAEGVENLRQIRVLKGLRCDEVQGFFISKPLPATDRQPFLTKEVLHALA